MCVCVSRRVELEQEGLDWIGNNQVRSGWLTEVGGGGKICFVYHT